MSRCQLLSVLLALALSACGRGDGALAKSLMPAEGTHSNDSVAATRMADVSPHTAPRLDAPLTPDNSFLVDLGGGVVLRIPSMLDPSIDPAQVREPVKAKSIAMTFWYPDMTLTNLFAPDIPRRGEKGYKPPRDRFWVQILWMFYVPQDWDTFAPGSKQPPAYGPDPRPPRIELNRYCFRLVEGRCQDDMRRIPSGIEGLDALISEAWIQSHPEAATHRPESGGVYVAHAESPYELFMDCTSFDSVGCQANVYSKKHHLQYRMNFPPEAVVHTDELIRSIDKLLDGWAVQ